MHERSFYPISPIPRKDKNSFGFKNPLSKPVVFTIPNI